VHDLAKGQVVAPDGTFNPFTGHDFRGTLRPRYPLSAKREVPSHIPRPEYADDSDGAHTLLRAGRAVKETFRIAMVW
jgi:methionyl aminopeptidase